MLQGNMVTGRSQTNPTCLQWQKMVRQYSRMRATTGTRFDLVFFLSSTVISVKGGYAIYRSQNDQTFNI